MLELRARQRRNFLATLLLSEGVPLLIGGDELARMQRGNNNAYCQDNAISWIDWAAGDEDLIEFVARLCRLRRDKPVFRRGRFFTGDELRWFRPDGDPMGAADWASPGARAVGVAVPRGMLLVNAWWEPLMFHLPGGPPWWVEIDTADPTAGSHAEGTIELVGRSLVLLRAGGRCEIGGALSLSGAPARGTRPPG